MKIYSGWAYKLNREKRSHSNYLTYRGLMSRYQISPTYSKDRIDDENDIVYDIVEEDKKYRFVDYKIHRNIPNLSDDELALICDEGNLCYGYSKQSPDTIRIYRLDKNSPKWRQQ